MKIESYAYDYEDFILGKIFEDVKKGFYITIGDLDPTINNASRKFYYEGWNGINIVTEKAFNDFQQMRPKDQNLVSNSLFLTGKEAYQLFQKGCKALSLSQKIYFCHLKLGEELFNFLQEVSGWKNFRPMVLVITETNQNKEWLDACHNILESYYYKFALQNENLYFYVDSATEFLMKGFTKRLDLDCEDQAVLMEVVCRNIPKDRKGGRFESYSQFYEDFFLYAALKDVKNGFYIDVGANDPVHLSVTQHFYDCGWRGINIEPLKDHCIQLEKKRPEDINLCMGIGKEVGEMELLEYDALSSFAEDVIQDLEAKGKSFVKTKARIETLSNVYRSYCADREVHFCKIDVEGFEDQVLAGIDNWDCFRPWVYAIEATEPTTTISSHEKWEHYLLENGYEFVAQKFINRYYVDKSRKDIIENLNCAMQQFASMKILTINYGKGMERSPYHVQIGEDDQVVFAKDPDMSRLIPDENEEGMVSLSNYLPEKLGLSSELVNSRVIYHFNKELYLDNMTIYIEIKKKEISNMQIVSSLIKFYNQFANYLSEETDENSLRINWEALGFQISLFVPKASQNVIVYLF